MVGGKIVDYYTRKDGRTEFLVKGTGCEENDYRGILVDIPIPALKQVKTDDSIWWQMNTAMLRVFETEDVPFKYFNGYGSVGVREFYRNRANH